MLAINFLSSTNTDEKRVMNLISDSIEVITKEAD